MNVTPDALDYMAIVTGLGGGLALFLYGMRKMTDSLKTVAGSGLKDVLARLTTNRLTGALSGALVTSVIQSSSVTTVMVVGFVSSGLLTFTQSVGVIMGANVGTTVTAQIVAFDVTRYSLAMIAAGFLMELLATRQQVRYYGTALMGLGLLFFGMGLMSSATEPFRDHAPFVAFMQEARSPLLGLAAGFLFTAVVQSSSATAGIVIVLGTQGFITLENGIALILGSNVGTCATAMLSAIGKPREAVKAAVVHVLFNLAGVLTFVWFIPVFADLVRTLSPMATDLSGTARLAAEVPRQIANAHTVFNIACTLGFIGFAGTFAALADRLVPRRQTDEQPESCRPAYLDPLFLGQPAVALDRVKLELLRLADMARSMAADALSIALGADKTALDRLAARDGDIDELHGAIVSYLGELSMRDLVEPLPLRLQEYLGIANNLENIGDTVESGFVTAGYKRADANFRFATATAERLERLAGRALREYGHAVDAFRDRDAKAARRVLASKGAFNRAAEETVVELVAPMAERNSGPALMEYRLAIALVDETKRLHTLSRRIAREVIAARSRALDGRLVRGSGDSSISNARCGCQ